jgi:uncharacterized protein YqjF (DUF2071 family)
MVTRREFLELSASAVMLSAFVGGCSTIGSHVTDQTAHRPWPLPKTSWVLSMRWHDLLFAHWPVRVDLIRPLIPDVLEIDTFDGWCWIGVVPFRMSGVRPRYVPIPLAFPELNVRTYVKTRGRSGVWFFSLDAASWLSVRAARWLGLPYYDAQMTVQVQGDVVEYDSVRTHKNAPLAEFNARYSPTTEPYQAAPGTLDHWLTERYALYGALKPDRVVYGEIHHLPWPLQRARSRIAQKYDDRSFRIGSAGHKADIPFCSVSRSGCLANRAD